MAKKSQNFTIVSIIAIILALTGYFLYNKFFKKIELENYDMPQAEIGRISPAEPLPLFNFTDQNNQPINIEQYKGKVLIINFWATWCKPCIKELPQFDQMAEIFGTENMAIIPISIDSAVSLTKLEEFYQEHNINNLAIYRDLNLKAYEAVMAYGVPTTLIVDRDLNAHLKVSGYLDWHDPQIMNLLNSL
ncbi:MAG: TlpA family protein disulfide reductase [Rickettsiales bacterium]|jgi:thiol-disulfide isomerase/thioredoxin